MTSKANNYKHKYCLGLLVATAANSLFINYSNATNLPPIYENANEEQNLSEIGLPQYRRKNRYKNRKVSTFESNSLMKQIQNYRREKRQQNNYSSDSGSETSDNEIYSSSTEHSDSGCSLYYNSDEDRSFFNYKLDINATNLSPAYEDKKKRLQNRLKELESLQFQPSLLSKIEKHKKANNEEPQSDSSGFDSEISDNETYSFSTEHNGGGCSLYYNSNEDRSFFNHKLDINATNLSPAYEDKKKRLQNRLKELESLQFQPNLLSKIEKHKKANNEEPQSDSSGFDSEISDNETYSFSTENGGSGCSLYYNSDEDRSFFNHKLDINATNLSPAYEDKKKRLQNRLKELESLQFQPNLLSKIEKHKKANNEEQQSVSSEFDSEISDNETYSFSTENGGSRHNLDYRLSKAGSFFNYELNDNVEKYSNSGCGSDCSTLSDFSNDGSINISFPEKMFSDKRDLEEENTRNNNNLDFRATPNDKKKSDEQPIIHYRRKIDDSLNIESKVNTWPYDLDSKELGTKLSHNSSNSETDTLSSNSAGSTYNSKPCNEKIDNTSYNTQHLPEKDNNFFCYNQQKQKDSDFLSNFFGYDHQEQKDSDFLSNFFGHDQQKQKDSDFLSNFFGYFFNIFGHNQQEQKDNETAHNIIITEEDKNHSLKVRDVIEKVLKSKLAQAKKRMDEESKNHSLKVLAQAEKARQDSIARAQERISEEDKRLLKTIASAEQVQKDIIERAKKRTSEDKRNNSPKVLAQAEKAGQDSIARAQERISEEDKRLLKTIALAEQVQKDIIEKAKKRIPEKERKHPLKVPVQAEKALKDSIARDQARMNEENQNHFSTISRLNKISKIKKSRPKTRDKKDRLDINAGMEVAIEDVSSMLSTNRRLNASALSAIAAGYDARGKNNSNIWIRGVCGSSVQKPTTGHIGSRGNIHGESIGAQYETDCGNILGISYSNLKGAYRYKDSDKVDVNFNIFSIYAQGEVGNLTLQTIASYGHNKAKLLDYVSDDSRPTEFGNFTNTSYILDATAGYKFQRKNINIMPFLQARYMRSRNGAYKARNGDGSEGKSYGKKSFDTSLAKLGIEFSKPIMFKNSMLLTPHFTTSIETDLSSTKNRISALDHAGKQPGFDKAENGEEFRRAKFGYNIGAGIIARRANTEISIDYIGHFRSKYHSHQGSLKLTIYF